MTIQTGQRLGKPGQIAIALLILITAVAYAQTGMIQGQITGFDGKPLASVMISIDRLGIHHHYQAKSDSRGRYTHSGLPTGQYELSITHEGKLLKLQTRVRFGDNSTVNFDLRRLLPYGRENLHRVNATSLTVPGKAKEEWQKAFDAKGDLDKAERHLEKAIEIAPDFEEALNDLGTIYHRRKQYAEAAVLFERALNINPESVTARVNLGGVLIALQQYERALAENLRVLANRPNDALANGQAGLSLLGMNRYEEAIPHFQQAKQSDPNSALLPGYFLAEAYDHLGRAENAIAEYEEFLKTHPQDPYRSNIETRLDLLRRK
jgi:tetratricopeptide (TPR) repeat protein